MSHLLGHEGKGSLLSYLKAKGWANSLWAMSYRGAKGFEFFRVRMDLTEDGLENVENIILCVFQYLRMLRQTGAEERIWTELRDLARIRFRFKEKENPLSFVTDHAWLLQVLLLDSRKFLQKFCCKNFVAHSHSHSFNLL